MKTSRTFLCTICASILLSGCSYFDIGDEEPNLEAVPVEEQVNTQIPQEQLNNIDLMAIANQSSDPSVQIYSLDGHSGPDKFDAAATASRPKVLSSGSSVQVFPLDDAMRSLVEPTVFNPAAPAAAPALPVESQPLDRPVSGEPTARVYFDHDSDSVNAEGAQTIASVVRQYKSGGQGLSVEGHASVKANYADEIQRRIVNLRVSMNRAVAVARSLIEGGVPADSIRTVAWGDTRSPLAIAGKDAEESARRVEIYAASLQ